MSSGPGTVPGDDGGDGGDGDDGAPAAVLVTVGTDHHRFDRLMTWVDHWATRHPGVVCFVQSGTSAPPQVCPSSPYLAADDLGDAMAGATVVVSHGGPATIMGARAVGRLPIVVPRRSDLDEHVDDHQVRFSRWMAGRGQVRLAEDEATLVALLDETLADPAIGRTDPHDPAVDAAVRCFGELVDHLVGR